MGASSHQGQAEWGERGWELGQRRSCTCVLLEASSLAPVHSHSLQEVSEKKLAQTSYLHGRMESRAAAPAS